MIYRVKTMCVMSSLFITEEQNEQAFVDLYRSKKE